MTSRENSERGRRLGTRPSFVKRPRRPRKQSSLLSGGYLFEYTIVGLTLATYIWYIRMMLSESAWPSDVVT